MNLTKDLLSNFQTIIDYQKKNDSNKTNKNIWQNRMPIWFSRIIKDKILIN